MTIEQKKQAKKLAKINRRKRRLELRNRQVDLRTGYLKHQINFMENYIKNLQAEEKHLKDKLAKFKTGEDLDKVRKIIKSFSSSGNSEINLKSLEDELAKAGIIIDEPTVNTTETTKDNNDVK